MALEALHKGLDGMEVTRLHDGRVVVALLDGLPDLRWGLAELVELTHVFGTVCGQLMYQITAVNICVDVKDDGSELS